MRIDFKSLLIGVLATALLASMMGAGDVPHQRYQIAAAPGQALYVLDHSTNKVFVIMPEDSAWRRYKSFSIDDAISKDAGAPIEFGPAK
jgi:hypothetical protein